jgi:DNA-3-methyladenine glycosylase
MDALSIAKKLLGKIIVTHICEKKCMGRIVETEAYMAPEDLACHARGNRRTPRTETMFSRPGTAYVYKCYGIHDLFNVVTAPENIAHAILIRGIEPIEGIQWMEERRKMTINSHSITNGPGKLTSAMGIDTSHDGINLTLINSPISICEAKLDSDFEIIEGPRVGMSHHTKHCGHYPWRYRIKDNRWTSKPDVVEYKW